ncbi:hypothetical protein [Alteromonas sp. C1M14]|uniref:hypothetical protein n=1 Tax=Alteromonas sp. C1M14 TaxID=2841567 RepID=UPI001C090DBF|nr:hypothetical protein [Alteromonas sp. C1M14]MBU2978744.1 hypothetical protein [Alteromonas sp. C1M14]
MSTLLKKLTSANAQSASINLIQTQCNYADNYYGDQVCVAVKSNINEQANSLSRQSGAAE